MTYSNTALAKHKIERSLKAVADAQILLKSGTPGGALEMGLRAAKEAAEAALIAANVQGLRSESLLYLTMGFVKDDRLSEKSFGAFHTIMDLCQYANERDFSAVNQSVAGAAVENVKSFIREMGNIVKRSER